MSVADDGVFLLISWLLLLVRFAGGCFGDFYGCAV